MKTATILLALATAAVASSSSLSSSSSSSPSSSSQQHGAAVAAHHRLRSSSAAAGGDHVGKGRRFKQLRARRVARGLGKDAERLRGLAERVRREGHKEMTFQDSSSSSAATSTTVEATYGVVSIYDFVVDVDIVDAEGTSHAVPVIMDTGSSNLAVATSLCENCKLGATDLDLTLESPEYCIEVTYGSGAWLGALVDGDTEVSIGDISGSSKLALTAILEQDDFFEGGYSGIFGLSYPALAGTYSRCSSMSSSSSGSATKAKSKDKDGGHHKSSSKSVADKGEDATGVLMGHSSSGSISAHTLFEDWAESGVIDSNVFAITYCEQEALLTVGAVDDSTYTGSLTYVETQKTFDEYYGYFLAEVESMSFDGESLDLSDADINEYGGVLVDSGTTLLYLPSAVTKQLKTLVGDACDDCDDDFFEWDSCLSTETAESLPSFTISFAAGSASGDGYTMEFTWARYLYNYGGCLYWGVSSSDLGIIGNIAQQGHTIVFDVDNNQLGFATADCSSISSSSSTSSSSSSSSSSSTASTASSSSALRSMILSAKEAATSLTGFYLGLALVAGFVVVAAVFAVLRSRRANGYSSVSGTDEFVI